MGVASRCCTWGTKWCCILFAGFLVALLLLGLVVNQFRLERLIPEKAKPYLVPQGFGGVVTNAGIQFGSKTWLGNDGVLSLGNGLTKLDANGNVNATGAGSFGGGVSTPTLNAGNIGAGNIGAEKITTGNIAAGGASIGTLTASSIFISGSNISINSSGVFPVVGLTVAIAISF